jgi:arabinose-5-phosphate isomerase
VTPSEQTAPPSDLPDPSLVAATEAVRHETAAVAALANRLDDAFLAVVDEIDQATGRVVVAGLGKSGIIGRKIAATLASTGTPATFVHAAEALHGDSGMLTPGDVLLAISASGETVEVCQFAHLATARGITVIALVGKPDSTLGRVAKQVVDVSVPREADPLNLAPTSSTTATLVMGDALAAALMVRRGFTAADFAGFHPGGSLGARLLEPTGEAAAEIEGEAQ